MRILVCGGRDLSNTQFVYRTLDAAYKSLGLTRDDILMEGDARGADRIAGYWARNRGLTNLKFPAKWDTYGKSAGPIRNREMLENGKPDIVIAFPGGTGTADMVRIAREAGLKIYEITAELKTEASK